MTDARRDVLNDLLECRRPLDELRVALAQFPWDSDKDLVELVPGHVINVLQRFLAGNLSGDEVTTWANLIEGREDIGFEAGREELLRQLIFKLANPELTEPITHSTATAYLSELSARP